MVTFSLVFSHIKRPIDVSEEDVLAAASESASARGLFQHLVSVSAPNAGSTKVLLLFAKMADSAEWVDGDLRVELSRKGESTEVRLLSELGGGMRERVFPPALVKASLAEFSAALLRVPHRILPLVVRTSTEDTIVLCTERGRAMSGNPVAVKIAEDSFQVPRAPRSPRVSKIPEGLLPSPPPLPTRGPTSVRTLRTPSIPSIETIDASWGDEDD